MPAAAATLVIVAFAVAIYVIYLAAFGAEPPRTAFAWSGTIGTLILLVVYVLATIGCIILVFVQRKLPVPMWQIIVPLAALVVLGYTLYRNVIPYPPSGPGRWFPVVAGIWLVVALVAVFVAPGFSQRLGAALTAREGIGEPALAEGGSAADVAAPPPVPDDELLPAVADLRLTDHHCHGVLRRDLDRPAFEAMLTEADYPGGPGVTMFGSQLGLALRRSVLRRCWGWPRTPARTNTWPRGPRWGGEEVSRRFLRAAGLGALYVDTGFEPEPLTDPAELVGLAGLADGRAREIVRLEQVAEAVGARSRGEVAAAGEFAAAFRAELAGRTRHAAGRQVGRGLPGRPGPGPGPADGDRGRGGRGPLAGHPGRGAGRGWPTRCCTGSSSGARPTSGCRSSSTWATATATSTCTGATRCC